MMVKLTVDMGMESVATVDVDNRIAFFVMGS